MFFLPRPKSVAMKYDSRGWLITFYAETKTFFEPCDRYEAK